MFEDWNNGTVINIIFPNSDAENPRGHASIFASNRGRSHYRIFYELTGIDEKFYNVTEWKISTELKVSIHEMLIPIGLGYIVKVGTMDEFTKPIKYYEANNDRTDYKSTNRHSVLAKIINDETGYFAMNDDIYAMENSLEDAFFTMKGVRYYLKDFEKYVSEKVFDFYSESGQ